MRTVSLLAVAVVAITLTSGRMSAQKPPDPEVGYVFPPGIQRGQTAAVQLAGFDWTPDLEFFTLDPRIRLTVEGPLSRHLMPQPPFPVGIRAYRPPPLPREMAASITVLKDFPPGPVRWQVANANGASSTGVFVVGDGPEIVENRRGADPQRLDRLPAAISGRLGRFEEVDCYLLEPRRDGLVTCDLQARRLGSNFNGVLEVKDETGRLITDAVDSQGLDTAVTWMAKAGSGYRVFVRDLNFRGNRAYVYRLLVSVGPRVLASIPAAVRRGTSTEVELTGYGLATGRNELEQITRTVNPPSDLRQAQFAWRGETDAGQPIDFLFPLSDLPELVEPLDASGNMPVIGGPTAVTGRLDRQQSSDRYRLKGRQGDHWNIAVEARRLGSPLDVAISVIGPDGKELAANDDLPGTTDAGLEFTMATDGIYEIEVKDVSGAARNPLNVYRLAARHAEPDFALQVPQHANAPIGEKAELLVKVVRTGGFHAPIRIVVAGLPEGVSVPEDLVIAADQAELKIPLQSVADAPSGATFVTITGTAEAGQRRWSHAAHAQAAGNLAARNPDEMLVESILVASTMKPVSRIRPMETDERTVHRGTMHLAELSIERVSGFDGEVLVQMDSRQPAKFRQGILGPDVIVPAGADRIFYPCFVPEMAETADAYRVLLVAIAQVSDSRGRVRHLLSKMQADDASVAITVEGALLKISVADHRVSIRPGETVQIPVKVARSAKLPAAVRLEAVPPLGMEAAVQSQAIFVPPEEGAATMAISLGPNVHIGEKLPLTIRALALQPGRVPALPDSAEATPLDPEVLAILKSGMLPVMAETTVLIEAHAGPSSER